MLFLLLPVIAFAQIKRTNPPTLSKPTGYTHVVEVSGAAKTVYISGQIAFDKDGKVVGAGDMKAQAEQVFKNLQEKAPAVREVRARYFGDTAPASTLVQVVHLARPELMLEVEVIAVVANR
jgi:enamine deaminase RidA (YjgF/YER057c/UK114 family)